MARLFNFDYSNNDDGEKKPNFKVMERDGHRYVAWSEDLDVVIINQEELSVLANALGYNLVSA